MLIRPATTADMIDIHALVRELAIFELEPEAHTATIEDYLRDWEAGFFTCAVAVDASAQVLGMIFYYKAYSTWKGRMLYLEDFVVKESHRSAGIGKLLFDYYLEEAQRLGCKVAKWQILFWNKDAIRFYERQGASIEKEWYNGKINF